MPTPRKKPEGAGGGGPASRSRRREPRKPSSARAGIAHAEAPAGPPIRVKPATPERWPDVERLFGERGACAGCWCMWWRLGRKDWERGKGASNRRALHRLVAGGETPGLLAYAGGEPVGWCAVAPREAYPVLERSRTLARLDDEPVWSVVCFFVARPFRKRGVSGILLRAAVEFAEKRGATFLEGYPVEPRKGAMPDAFAWTGLAAAFREAGFVEALRRSESRPIMRYEIRRSSPTPGTRKPVPRRPNPPAPNAPGASAAPPPGRGSRDPPSAP